MSIAPTIVYFGRYPSTIIMQSTSQFDGTTAQGSLPTITPALYTFPPQAGGGLYNFHDLVGCQEQVAVLSISYKGGGSLTVSRVFSNVSGTPTIQIGTITSQGDLVFGMGDLTLSPFEDLMLVSTGGSSPVVAITGKIAASSWTN